MTPRLPRTASAPLARLPGALVLPVVLILPSVLVVSTVAAAPAQAAACSGTSGVTVVVDYGSTTSVRCAPGDPSSGFAALSGAGFSVTTVQQFPGAVCRINGVPAEDPCVRMPPASASWSYWHAQRGGSWSYSNVGAGSYNPAPGSVEGWSFGSGAAPGIAPPAPDSAPPPSRTPEPAPTSSGSGSSSGSSADSGSSSSGSAGRGGSTGSGSSVSGTSSGSTPKAGSATPTTTRTPKATRSATPKPGPSDRPTQRPTEDATAALSAEPTSATAPANGLTGLLLGGGLVAALGGLTAYLLWKRRREAAS